MTHARQPSELDLRAWKRILLRVYETNYRENLSLIAAGMAFYGLLGLVPAIGALASLYGLVANPTDIQSHLDLLNDVVPEEAMQIIRERVDAADDTAGQPLGVGVLLGTLLAIWTARLGVAAAMAGLNLAYREREGRSIVMSYVVPYVLTFVLLIVAAITLGALVVTPAIIALVPLGPVTEWVASVVRWPIAFFAAIFGLAALYRYAPHRRRAKTRWVSWGAVIAAVLWALGSALFTWYVREFGAYAEGYGALGAVLALLMWFWLSAYAALIGGAINAEMEFETEVDTTVGPDRPRGERGAFVADNLPDEAEPRGEASR